MCIARSNISQKKQTYRGKLNKTADLQATNKVIYHTLWRKVR